MEQWYSLAHHVTSHQGAVTVIMLKEWDKTGRYGCYLLRSNVHKVYVRRRNDREVCVLTALYDLADKGTILVKRCVTLSDNMVLLILSRQVDYIAVVHINNTISNLTVRSGDETKLVDGRVYAKRGDKTDVRALRALNRTQAAIMCIVNVTNLETCALTRQTTRTQCGETALVSNLGKRVGLVHKLGKRIGSEECIDDA